MIDDIAQKNISLFCADKGKQRLSNTWTACISAAGRSDQTECRGSTENQRNPSNELHVKANGQNNETADTCKTNKQPNITKNGKCHISHLTLMTQIVSRNAQFVEAFVTSCCFASEFGELVSHPKTHCCTEKNPPEAQIKENFKDCTPSERDSGKPRIYLSCVVKVWKCAMLSQHWPRPFRKSCGRKSFFLPDATLSPESYIEVTLKEHNKLLFKKKYCPGHLV